MLHLRNCARGLRAFAALGIGLTVVVGSISYASAASESQTIKSVASAIATQANFRSPKIADTYQPKCDSPANSIDAQYCDQLKATEAVNRQADYARWEVIIGLAGVIGLLVTLFFTGWAAVSAGNSAAASRKILEHDKERAEKELRPYVFVDEVQFERKSKRPNIGVPHPPKGPTGRITYQYRNFGKTPARDVRIAVKAKIVDNVSEIDLSDIGEFRDIGPIAPKEFLTDEVEIEGLTKNEAPILQTIVDGGKHVHFWGRIEYNDEFSGGRWTTFHSYVGNDVKWEPQLHAAKIGNDYDAGKS